MRLVRLTDEGRRVRARCWERVLESERVIFEQLPKAHRSSVIAVLRQLNRAVEQWQDQCGLGPSEGGSGTAGGKE